MTPPMSNSPTDERCRSQRSTATCEELGLSLAWNPLAADAPLRSPDEGEHDPDDQHDDGHPDEKVGPAHRGRGDAAKSEHRGDQRDDDQNQRVVDEISWHKDSLSKLADSSFRKPPNAKSRRLVPPNPPYRPSGMEPTQAAPMTRAHSRQGIRQRAPNPLCHLRHGGFG